MPGLRTQHDRRTSPRRARQRRPDLDEEAITRSPNRLVATIFGAVYLLVGIEGFFIVDTAANILALNTPGHVLHLGSAIVLLGVGLDRDTTSRRAAV